MKTVLRFALVALLISRIVLPAAARKKMSRHAQVPNKTEVDAAARLQIFLDRANFSPGKIDGRYSNFTRKALALYRESQGQTAQIAPRQSDAKSNTAPDVAGLDLASVEPVFVSYTVTEADLQSVGPLPSKLSAESKLKFLPYRDAADAIAEKFHSDVRFLNQLNPGKMKTIKPGEQLMVPNIEPFELASVKAIKPGSEVNSHAANDIEEQAAAQSENPDQSNGATANVIVKVDTKINMLGVYEAEKLIAAYPVTIGSAHTVSPSASGRYGVSPSCQLFVMTKKCFNTAGAAGISTCSRPVHGILWG